MATEEPKCQIVPRKEAIASGLQFYFTGKPCKYGHLDRRRLLTNACQSCELERGRKWRSENLERARARDNSWKELNREKLRQQERDRYAENPRKYVEKQQRFYAKNSDKIRERRRAYHYEVYTDPSVRAAASERTRQWTLDNPERAKANRRNGKARRRNIPGSHTAEDIAEIFKSQKGKCAYCRIKMGDSYTVDHIKPVSKGGTNDRKNIQLACIKCNREKHARDPLLHARMLGMLI